MRLPDACWFEHVAKTQHLPHSSGTLGGTPPPFHNPGHTLARHYVHPFPYALLALMDGGNAVNIFHVRGMQAAYAVWCSTLGAIPGEHLFIKIIDCMRSATPSTALSSVFAKICKFHTRHWTWAQTALTRADIKFLNVR